MGRQKKYFIFLKKKYEKKHKKIGLFLVKIVKFSAIFIKFLSIKN